MPIYNIVIEPKGQCTATRGDLSDTFSYGDVSDLLT